MRNNYDKLKLFLTGLKTISHQSIVITNLKLESTNQNYPAVTNR